MERGRRLDTSLNTKLGALLNDIDKQIDEPEYLESEVADRLLTLLGFGSRIIKPTAKLYNLVSKMNQEIVTGQTFYNNEAGFRHILNSIEAKYKQNFRPKENGEQD